MKQETFEIEAEYEGERLDKYLSVIFEQSKTSSNAPSRSFFQKLIRDGHVKVNVLYAKANYRLRMDDLVCVEIPDAVEHRFSRKISRLIFYMRTMTFSLSINRKEWLYIHQQGIIQAP